MKMQREFREGREEALELFGLGWRWGARGEKAGSGEQGEEARKSSAGAGGWLSMHRKGAG